MTKFMDKERKCGLQLEASTKADGNSERSMARVKCFMLTKVATLDNGVKTNVRARASWCGLLQRAHAHTRETSWMI